MDSSTSPVSRGRPEDLLVDLDRAFATTGAATPGWPDPRSERPEPAEDEYSRCLDPGKYRILDARVEAWARVLAGRGIAVASAHPPGPPAWLGAHRPVHQLDRVHRIEPTAAGGLVLLLARTIVDGAPFGLDVAIATPADPSAAPVLVDLIPRCGCDACDDGSAALLAEVDGWFLAVARGGTVHVRDGARSVTRTADGWSGSGDVDGSWLDPSASTPPGRRAWSGAPWL